jgi:hypothetical protein
MRPLAGLFTLPVLAALACGCSSQPAYNTDETLPPEVVPTSGAADAKAPAKKAGRKVTKRVTKPPGVQLKDAKSARPIND